MTTARVHHMPDRLRVVLIVAALALGALLVVGAWQAGTSLRPDAADAAAARQAAYDASYDDARAASYDAAYADAWEPAFERGAAAGQREGTAAGVATARAELAAASTTSPG